MPPLRAADYYSRAAAVVVWAPMIFVARRHHARCRRPPPLFAPCYASRPPPSKQNTAAKPGYYYIHIHIHNIHYYYITCSLKVSYRWNQNTATPLSRNPKNLGKDYIQNHFTRLYWRVNDQKNLTLIIIIAGQRRAKSLGYICTCIIGMSPKLTKAESGIKQD
jgi:hypothetical protein